jgi:hypothetical protein
MLRLIFCALLILLNLAGHAQERSIALGVYTGFTIPYTIDGGINKDPRYKSSYKLKSAPIGLNFSMDYEGFGVLINPGLIHIGEDFWVINVKGGQEGVRKINMQYFNLPVGIKLHIIDMSFFRVSATASVAGSYLLNGKETISHAATKLSFPTEVYPILPPGYNVDYDGVNVPEVHDYPMLSKNDFQKIQLFGSAGLHSDWDVSNDWRVSFDFRVGYALTDSRTKNYLDRLNAYQTLYDFPGKRREAYAQFSVGISRYIEFDKSDRDRKKKLKGSKKFTPKTSPKRSKPRG